jgi:hypothetical protein
MHIRRNSAWAATLLTLTAFVLTGWAAPLSAVACSYGPLMPWESTGGTDASPPAVRIDNVAVSLGYNYGKDGPGDCSHLGDVEILLSVDDAQDLDGYGAIIKVLSGHIPAYIDFDNWIAPIENNRVYLMIHEWCSAVVAFTITVQLVNASGERGTPSQSQAASADVPSRYSPAYNASCELTGRPSPAYTCSSYSRLDVGWTLLIPWGLWRLRKRSDGLTSRHAASCA